MLRSRQLFVEAVRGDKWQPIVGSESGEWANAGGEQEYRRIRLIEPFILLVALCDPPLLFNVHTESGALAGAGGGRGRAREAIPGRPRARPVRVLPPSFQSTLPDRLPMPLPLPSSLSLVPRQLGTSLGLASQLFQSTHTRAPRTDKKKPNLKLKTRASFNL